MKVFKKPYIFIGNPHTIIHAVEFSGRESLTPYLMNAVDERLHSTFYAYLPCPQAGEGYRVMADFVGVDLSTPIEVISNNIKAVFPACIEIFAQVWDDLLQDISEELKLKLADDRIIQMSKLPTPNHLLSGVGFPFKNFTVEKGEVEIILSIPSHRADADGMMTVVAPYVPGNIESFYEAVLCAGPDALITDNN